MRKLHQLCSYCCMSRNGCGHFGYSHIARRTRSALALCNRERTDRQNSFHHFYRRCRIFRSLPYRFVYLRIGRCNWSIRCDKRSRNAQQSISLLNYSYYHRFRNVIYLIADLHIFRRRSSVQLGRSVRIYRLCRSRPLCRLYYNFRSVCGRSGY